MTNIEDQAKELAKEVLHREFIAPFLGLADEHPIALLRLSNPFLLLRLSEQLVVESDRARIHAGGEVEAVHQKVLFLGYLGKLYQSALLLIGATDYLGGVVVLRSVFELLIGMTAGTTGTMREKIRAVDYLDDAEKHSLQTLWNDFSAWAHPYGKWVKNVCPRLYGIGRHHHPRLLNECITYSDRVLDLLLTIAVEDFGITGQAYRDEYARILQETDVLDVSHLEMFERRMRMGPQQQA